MFATQIYCGELIYPQNLVTLIEVSEQINSWNI